MNPSASLLTANEDTGETPVAAPLNHHPRKDKLRRWTVRLATFFFGQGLVQVLNLVTGFLLIRWLSISDYAAYSLVTGFQGTIGILAELGLGNSIVALVAGRLEPQVIGSYIRSTRHYRNRFFIALLPVILITFPILTFRQGWSISLTAFLLGAIITTLYFQSWATYYSVPLLIHQELALYYRTPSLLGGARLLLNLGLHSAALLNSAAAVWLSSLSTLAQGWFYKRQSARHIVEPIASDPATNREVISYIRPLIPSTIFFALQGQIGIFLISWFGKAQSIAEVGALGRLGQLFVMLGAFNGVVVAPYIARVARQDLARRYLQVIAGALAFSSVLIAVACFAPHSLLWILGKKYSNLETELVWMMASACTGYLTGVMWTMHSARKWIFSWGVWSYIATVVLVQIAGLTFMDLSGTKHVILFSLYSSLATMVVQVAWGIVGFNDRRKSFAP